jgi:hypothetical protein
VKKRLLIITLLALLVGALIVWLQRTPELPEPEPDGLDTAMVDQVVPPPADSTQVALSADSLKRVRIQLQKILKMTKSGNRGDQREAVRLARNRIFFTAYPERELTLCAFLPSLAGDLIQNRDFELEVLGQLERGLGAQFPDSLRKRQLVAHVILAERHRRMLPLDLQWNMARMDLDLQGNSKMDPQALTQAILSASMLGRTSEVQAWMKRLPKAHADELKAALKAPAKGAAIHPVHLLVQRMKNGKAVKDSVSWKGGAALGPWQAGLDWILRLERNPMLQAPDSLNPHEPVVVVKGEHYLHPLRHHLDYLKHRNAARRLVDMPIQGLSAGERAYWKLALQWLDQAASVTCKQVEKEPAGLQEWQSSNWKAWQEALCPNPPSSAPEALQKAGNAWQAKLRVWDVHYRRGQAWLEHVSVPAYSQDMNNPVHNAIWLRYEIDRLERKPDRLSELDNHIVNELTDTEMASDETDAILLMNAIEHEMQSGDYQSAEAFLCRLPMKSLESTIGSVRQYINTAHLLENRGIEFHFYKWIRPANMWVNSYMTRSWTCSYWEM